MKLLHWFPVSPAPVIWLNLELTNKTNTNLPYLLSNITLACLKWLNISHIKTCLHCDIPQRASDNIKHETALIKTCKRILHRGGVELWAATQINGAPAERLGLFLLFLGALGAQRERLHSSTHYCSGRSESCSGGSPGAAVHSGWKHWISPW